MVLLNMCFHRCFQPIKIHSHTFQRFFSSATSKPKISTNTATFLFFTYSQPIYTMHVLVLPSVLTVFEPPNKPNQSVCLSPFAPCLCARGWQRVHSPWIRWQRLWSMTHMSRRTFFRFGSGGFWLDFWFGFVVWVACLVNLFWFCSFNCFLLVGPWHKV